MSKIKSIRSGGQTGVDRAALDVAKERKIQIYMVIASKNGSFPSVQFEKLKKVCHARKPGKIIILAGFY